MSNQRVYLFNNKFTGEVKALTKSEGRKLNEDWARIKAVTNDAGHRVLRMELNGATVDISESEQGQDVQSVTS